MNFFGRTKAKGPADTIKALKDHIVRLDQTSSAESKKRVSPALRVQSKQWVMGADAMQINEEISRLLSSTKQTLSGEIEPEASGDVVALVANEVYALDLLNLMVLNLGKFEFEVGTGAQRDCP